MDVAREGYIINARPFLVSTVRARPLYIYIYRRHTSPPGPRVVPVWSPYGVFPCTLRLRSTTCYSELIEESVFLFAMDSTRREAALARRRERERARRANAILCESLLKMMLWESVASVG